MEYDAAKIPQAEAFASAGLLLKRMAALWGVSYKTVWQWRQDHPEFEAALERGEANAIYNLSLIAMHDALGEKKDGVVIREPNADRAMQLLKHLERERFGDVQRQELTGANGGAINFYELSDEERVIRIAAKLQQSGNTGSAAEDEQGKSDGDRSALAGSDVP